MAEKKDFQMTREEAERITEALKKEEFRKLLAEYAEEIQDPQNRERYEQEITELEKMRGVDVKFVNPKPGFVLKTTLLPDGAKAFVNICQSEAVAMATSSGPSTEGKKKGEQWQIPFSLTSGREDLDKAKKKCLVFDAVFHPETYKKGQQNPRFRQLLISTAVDGIEDRLGHKLDREHIKVLRMPYKGIATPAVIRTKGEKPADSADPQVPLDIPYPPLKPETGQNHGKVNGHTTTKKEAGPETERGKAERGTKPGRKEREPKYRVTHRGEFSMQDFTHDRVSGRVRRPQELTVSVELPGVESAAGLDLDIFEKSLVLQCSSPSYKLTLPLPYPVDEERAGAKFDRSAQTLVITLPVVQLKPSQSSHTAAPLVTETAPSSEPEFEHETTNQNEEPESCDQDTSLMRGDDQDTVTEQPTVSMATESGRESTNDRVQAEDTDACHGWTSVGAWQCPPLHFSQDEERVSFVLCTVGVKESSIVSHFDLHSFQVTYRTASRGVREDTQTPGADGGSTSYSLFVQFPNSCTMAPDDCKVDVSEDNVVVIVTKAEDSREMWEGFQTGVNSTSKLEQKLFLTAANVRNVVEGTTLTDPWAHGSDRPPEAICKVVSQTDEHLDVQLLGTDVHQDGPGTPSSMGEGLSGTELEGSSDRVQESHDSSGVGGGQGRKRREGSKKESKEENAGKKEAIDEAREEKKMAPESREPEVTVTANDSKRNEDLRAAEDDKETTGTQPPGAVPEGSESAAGVTSGRVLPAVTVTSEREQPPSLSGAVKVTDKDGSVYMRVGYHDTETTESETGQVVQEMSHTKFEGTTETGVDPVTVTMRRKHDEACSENEGTRTLATSRANACGVKLTNDLMFDLD